MTDQNKSEQQLLDELAELRRRLATLEAADTQRQRSEERNHLLMESIPQTVWRAAPMAKPANLATIGTNIQARPANKPAALAG